MNGPGSQLRRNTIKELTSVEERNRDIKKPLFLNQIHTYETQSIVCASVATPGGGNMTVNIGQLLNYFNSCHM